MTIAMKRQSQTEIDFLTAVLSMEEPEDLKLIESTGEALAILEELKEYDDFVPSLLNPKKLADVWNYCIGKLKEDRTQQEDDAIAELNPDCLRFRNMYPDGSSAFFDLEQLKYDLLHAGYDEVHREIILKALTSYVNL